jgi:hypothetical protein
VLVTTNEIHVGDVGTALQFLVMDGATPVDLSQATVLQVVFWTAQNRRWVVPVSLATDGKDGLLQYVTVSGDLDVPGVWHYQVTVHLPSGSWSSSVGTFTVFPNL